MSRTSSIILSFLFGSILLGLPIQPVDAATRCVEKVEDGSDSVMVIVECEDDGSSSEGGGDPPAQGEYIDFRWLLMCPLGAAHDLAVRGPWCGTTRMCPAGLRPFDLWGLTAPPNSHWEFIRTECRGLPVDDPGRGSGDQPPTITPGDVLRELRRIGLPSLITHIQPAHKTLVNFDTIFYTDAETFTATVGLLGQRVDIEAEPTGFTWHYGDGSSEDTTRPGAPYPALQITHRYTNADVTVHPRVDVTYTSRFRVNRGPWQPIEETITITGPSTDLRIVEAVPVLVGTED